jgi:hypothetical protein
LSESRVREIRTHGSTGGVWRRGKAGIMRHRRPKGPGTARPSLIIPLNMRHMMRSESKTSKTLEKKALPPFKQSHTKSKYAF